MTPLFNSPRKQSSLLAPSPQTKTALLRVLGFVLVEEMEGLWNQLENYVIQSYQEILSSGIRVSDKSLSAAILT
jgi:hypothetical protein